jgi:hypothetical protein
MDFDRILHVGLQDLLLPASRLLDDQIDLVCLAHAAQAGLFNTIAHVV